MSETQVRRYPTPDDPGRGPLQPVRLLGVPVELFLRSAQHADDLIRELWLMSMTRDDGATADYRRLAGSADLCINQGAKLRSHTVAQVVRARTEGADTVDLAFLVPGGTAQATLDWDAILDDLDALCRRGQLLSLASPDEVLAFRRWYVGETVRQLQQGQRPTPYAEWRQHGWPAGAPQPTGA